MIVFSILNFRQIECCNKISSFNEYSYCTGLTWIKSNKIFIYGKPLVL